MLTAVHDGPVRSKTGAKWEFSDPCLFAGNKLNVKKLQTIESSFPLKNYPMSCTFCEKTVWRFDMLLHMKEHPDEECPAEGVVSEAEKGLLRAKKKRTANALSARDLGKLTDDQLRLLPTKDFWDESKKKWKTNYIGTFAKQNSLRMKRIFGPAAFQSA